MMFLVIWIGFEDLDWIGFDSLQVDWIWIWIVACRDWIDSTKLDWIFGFYQPLIIRSFAATTIVNRHRWSRFNLEREALNERMGCMDGREGDHNFIKYD